MTQGLNKVAGVGHLFWLVYFLFLCATEQNAAMLRPESLHKKLTIILVIMLKYFQAPHCRSKD